MTLNMNVFNAWNIEKEKWLSGKPVNKDVLIAELSFNNPPPIDCCAFLAAILQKQVTFKGSRKKHPASEFAYIQLRIAINVVRLERIYRRVRRDKKPLKGELPALDLAVEHSSQYYGIGTTYVWTYYSRFKEIARSIYSKN